MKTHFLLLLCSTLFSVSAADLTLLQVSPPATPEVVSSYYGKTLSSLGPIASIHISQPPNAAAKTDEPPIHSAVWTIIEQSKLRDIRTTSITSLPPFFQVEYSNGLRVQADKLSAKLIFPDGTSAHYVLLP